MLTSANINIYINKNKSTQFGDKTFEKSKYEEITKKKGKQLDDEKKKANKREISFLSFS